VKKAYHHGELRQALIDAARDLVREKGETGFSLSDACRRAGVSTAAPYRHFPDKHAILIEVMAQGFDDMTERTRAATEHFPPGAPERILAVGQVYLTFAVGEPALFRMMFGQAPTLPGENAASRAGKACFDAVLQEVERYCRFHGVMGDSRLIALQLWTLVHGAASLTIDGDYAKVAPELEIERLMTGAAERLLFSLPARRPQAGESPSP
jgi:AcrR family transcriptional regulator